MTLTRTQKLVIGGLAMAAMTPIFLWGVSGWTFVAAFVALVSVGIAAGLAIGSNR